MGKPSSIVLRAIGSATTAVILATALSSSAMAAPRGAAVTGTVPADGSWFVPNVMLYHNPVTDGTTIGIDVTNTIRYGGGFGVATQGGSIPANNWKRWTDGQTGYKAIFTDSAYTLYRPAVMMWGSGCGWVAPWDSCDRYFEGNWWGMGWSKNW